MAGLVGRRLSPVARPWLRHRCAAGRDHGGCLRTDRRALGHRRAHLRVRTGVGGANVGDIANTNIMTRHIDTATLRDWLEQNRPVTVLDVRTDEDRGQWAIPGSVHINAYDALRKGEPGLLQDAILPPDPPVVTVCNSGRMSEKAADVLTARGFDVLSLVGGMKAWSLAWNSADVPLTDAATRVSQIRRTGKGCLSYLIVSHGEAAVIDPSLGSVVYTNLAKQQGAEIRCVLDTHIHADHLSRARQLADEHDAQLVLPAQNRARFPFTAMADGDELRIGAATLTAMHTPGHTDESTAFLLNGEVVFSGDTLFVNGVRSE